MRFIILVLLLVGAVFAQVNVEPIMVKSIISVGEEVNVDLRVTNLGEKSVNLSVQSNREEFVVEDEKFVLMGGRSAHDFLRFKADIPGVYVGEVRLTYDGEVIKIPVIIEAESKNIAFDSIIELKNDLISGEELELEVNLFNLKELSDDFIKLHYYVMDFHENILWEEKDEVNVKAHKYFLKKINIPELGEGDYFVLLKVTKGTSVGTSTAIFRVFKEEEEAIVPNIFDICWGNKFCLTIVVVGCIALGLLFLIYLVQVFWISRIPKRKLDRIHKKPKKDVQKRGSLAGKVNMHFNKRMKDIDKEVEEEAKIKKKMGIK